MSTAPNVSIGDEVVAREHEILRVVVGSGTHGMAIEGTDDRDEMGVYVQTPDQLLGLDPTAEHYVSRTQPEGVRSGPGDVDLTVYALRKFIRLAAAGNPTVLLPFFSPEPDLLVDTPLGRSLQHLGREQFATRRAGRRFLGYLDGQRDRMLGIGKHMSRMPNRPELIAAHGYDTKYASHALRLGLQGIELLTTGSLSLPMRQPDLRRCLEVKRGEVDQAEALTRIGVVRTQLEETLAQRRLPVPDEPDMDAVNRWMVDAHLKYWGGLTE